MPTGTVKWFNNAKGYGFILPDEGSEDLFAHYSSIIMDGYRTLKAGQAVTFDIIQGDKGLHATNINTPGAPVATADTAESQDTPEITNTENAANKSSNDELEACS